MTEKARQIERHALVAWQAGTLMWMEALPLTSARDLIGLYVLAYRHGVRIERRFADEVDLPKGIRWDYLTPAIWKRNPAWRAVWRQQIERSYAYVSNPAEAVKASIQDLEGDGGIGRIRAWQAWSMQIELEKQQRERAAFSAWIRDLLS